MKNGEKEEVIVCSFQPRAVYEEIMKNGVYRLSRRDFITYAKIEERNRFYQIQEKYDYMMERSGLTFEESTMPMWGWHKEENGETVSPEGCEGILERTRRLAIKNNEKYDEHVGLFLKVPKEEVFLTHFLYWEFYLYSELHDVDLSDYDTWTDEEKEDYQEEVDGVKYYKDNLESIEGNVRVQAIMPEIRKEMIYHVMEEKITVES